MADIKENLKRWSSYDWKGGGDEWSEVWGSTENLWYGSLLPRIKSFLPASDLLEIAPGFGRITQYLNSQCATLTLVDLTERCINACRERFAAERRIRYIVNDGKSLPGVADQSVDFAFSYDSLVHVELDVMEGYIRELSRVLKPGGAAFLHHSNMAVFQDRSGTGLTIENKHWRGASVSADIVDDLCNKSGLTCFRQELVNWGGTDDLTDTFTHISRKGSPWDRQREIVRNPRFMDEALRIGRIGWSTGRA